MPHYDVTVMTQIVVITMTIVAYVLTYIGTESVVLRCKIPIIVNHILQKQTKNTL